MVCVFVLYSTIMFMVLIDVILPAGVPQNKAKHPTTAEKWDACTTARNLLTGVFVLVRDVCDQRSYSLAYSVKHVDRRSHLALSSRASTYSSYV